MAQNNTLIIFTPLNNEFLATNFASLNFRNQHPVLEFDESTDESAVFTGIMPNQYSGNGVTVYIHYCMATNNTGDINWEASFERIGDQVLDIDSDSFATAQTATETVPGTIGYVSSIGISFTDGAQMDAVAAGETFRLKITRDADTDSAIGDAQLLAIEIREN